MPNADIDVLRCAVLRAGRRVQELAAEGFEIHIKNDRTPVTTADLEVNRLLREDLIGAFPNDGWLSEETLDDGSRLGKTRVWVVDPIDGTKYFMKGLPQYTISVALVEGYAPRTAVVYNPATLQLFSAVRGAGAWLDNRRITVRESNDTRPTILVSPPARERGQFDAIADLADCRPVGSIAYTLALVAGGEADGVLNPDLLNEWDIAAGVLLIEEAGGTVVDGQGHRILFNQPKTAVHGLLASRPERQPQMRAFADLLSVRRSAAAARRPD